MAIKIENFSLEQLETRAPLDKFIKPTYDAFHLSVANNS